MSSSRGTRTLTPTTTQGIRGLCAERGEIAGGLSIFGERHVDSSSCRLSTHNSPLRLVCHPTINDRHLYCDSDSRSSAGIDGGLPASTTRSASLPGVIVPLLSSS